MSRPKGLGRGLTALLERDSDESPAAPRTSGDTKRNSVRWKAASLATSSSGGGA